MGARKMSYSDLKAGDDSRLDTVLNMSAQGVQRSANRRNMPPDDVRIDDDFAKLFNTDETLINDIAQSMSNEGFNPNRPLDMAIILAEDDTKDNPILIEGHQRLLAAKQAGIDEVPVYVHTFDTRNDALKAAIEYNCKRRQLTDGEKAKAVMMLDNLKKTGPKEDDDTGYGKSAEEIADTIGMGVRNVEKARNVMNNGDDETKEALLNDEISINAADKKTNEQKKAAKSQSDTDNDNAGTNGIYIDTGSKNDDDTADDGFSDALEDNSGNPSAVTIPTFSDGIERPTMTSEERMASDRVTLARKEGYDKAYMEQEEIIKDLEQKVLDTAADCFAKGVKFALSEIARGRAPSEVWHDERIADMSGELMVKFELPDDAESIIAGL